MTHYTLHKRVPKPMPIIYDHPRIGLFSIHTGEWGKDGWINREELRTIVGEEDLWYIEKFQPLLCGMWVGNAVVPTHEIIALGPHKSRLIRWVETQLTLNF